MRFGRPFGTYGLLGIAPNVETLGYSHLSLRDTGPWPFPGIDVWKLGFFPDLFALG
jgi:hypothetical protein